MKRCHLVYPHGPRKAAPWSIGNHLAIALRKAGYQVIPYDWEARVRMDVRPGDLLLGHPHEEPGFAFTDNLWQPFGARVAIAPWNGSEPYTRRLAQSEQVLNAVIPICGPYWADKAPDHWYPLDMAINATHYPRVRQKWNPQGARKILYVGCTLECKGPDLLSDLAVALAGEMEIHHVGPGLIPGAYPWGYVEMETDKGRAIAAGCDFVIAPGRADANPTTILEGVSWGLIPLLTRTSGWDFTEVSSIPFVDPTNLEGAVGVLRQLNQEPEAWLDSEQARMISYLQEYMSFERFTARVLEVIDNAGSSRRGH